MENKITIEQAVEIKNKVNHMCGLDIIDIYVYNRVHDEVEFYVNGWLISFTDVKSAIEKTACMIYDEVNTEMSKYSTIYTLTFVNDSIDETLKKHIYSKLEN